MSPNKIAILFCKCAGTPGAPHPYHPIGFNVLRCVPGLFEPARAGLTAR
jgi:hypothetical protein